MKVTTAMLADAATVADGKVYVHGGGWDVINTQAVPATHPALAIVLVIEFEWSETHVPRSLHVELLDEDDNALGVGAVGALTVGHPPGLARGAPISHPIALPFVGVNLPRVGRYCFRVRVDDDELGRVRFAVQTPPPLPPIPGQTAAADR